MDIVIVGRFLLICLKIDIKLAGFYLFVPRRKLKLLIVKIKNSSPYLFVDRVNYSYPYMIISLSLFIFIIFFWVKYLFSFHFWLFNYNIKFVAWSLWRHVVYCKYEGN
jgi:hypothetical protein